jgi:hypothetical protein
MQDSHTHVPADDAAGDSSRLRLIPASTAGLPEWLAGRVDEHLAVFVAQMTRAAGRLDRRTDRTTSSSRTGPRIRSVISSHSPSGIRTRSGPRSNAVADCSLKRMAASSRSTRPMRHRAAADRWARRLRRPHDVESGL